MGSQPTSENGGQAMTHDHSDWFESILDNIRALIDAVTCQSGDQAGNLTEAGDLLTEALWRVQRASNSYRLHQLPDDWRTNASRASTLLRGSVYPSPLAQALIGQAVTLIGDALEFGDAKDGDDVERV